MNDGRHASSHWQRFASGSFPIGDQESDFEPDTRRRLSGKGRIARRVPLAIFGPCSGPDGKGVSGWERRQEPFLADTFPIS
jgi:hypothetical protein